MKCEVYRFRDREEMLVQVYDRKILLGTKLAIFHFLSNYHCGALLRNNQSAFNYFEFQRLFKFF